MRSEIWREGAICYYAFYLDGKQVSSKDDTVRKAVETAGGLAALLMQTTSTLSEEVPWPNIQQEKEDADNVLALEYPKTKAEFSDKTLSELCAVVWAMLQSDSVNLRKIVEPMLAPALDAGMLVEWSPSEVSQQ